MQSHVLPDVVSVCSHPLLHHHLATLRDKNTQNEAFRWALRRVAGFVIQAATADLPLSKTIIETPLVKTEVFQLSTDVPILITPILRAGLTLSEVAIEMIPTASVYHVGLYRDEQTLKPITYYNKLPSSIDYSTARILMLDPMLATGGSAIAAMDIITELGVSQSNVSFACIIAAPEGVHKLHQAYPDIRIYTAALDERLNDKAYILPGLGDAGDRTFGTV